jgi:two-component system response regulator DctR
MTGPLSKQQKVVCELLTLGLSNKEIAQKMGIGRRTVESHREAVFDKMRVRNAVELTRKILEVAT